MPKARKRSPALLEELTNTLGAYVRANPGQRIEEIAKGLELSTKDLVLPVKKLIGTKAIKPQGQRRATRYFPTVLRAKAIKAKTLSSAKAARVARKKPASKRKRARVAVDTAITSAA
jgi:predicted transcriptional regulator